MRIIKITDTEVYVAKKDNSVIKLRRNDFDWQPKINEEIEMFEVDGEFIITKAVNQPQSSTPTQKTNYNYNAKPQPKNIHGNTKKLIGFLCCAFLGLIGLIIGLLCYEKDTYERNTFVSGWVVCFFIEAIIGLVIGTIFGVTFFLNYLAV